SGATVADLLVRNLAHVWTEFRAAGVELVVLARFAPSGEEVDAIRAALPGAELFVVSLTAPRNVLEERVHARDRGAELAHHLEAIAHGGPRAIAHALLVH